MSQHAHKFDELFDGGTTDDPDMLELLQLAGDLQSQMEAIPDSPREKVLRSVVLTEIVSPTIDRMPTARTTRKSRLFFAKTRRTLAASLALGLLVSTSAIAASDSPAGEAIRTASHEAAAKLHIVPPPHKPKPPQKKDGNNASDKSGDSKSSSKDSTKGTPDTSKTKDSEPIDPKDPEAGMDGNQEGQPKPPPDGQQPPPDGQQPPPDGQQPKPPGPGPCQQNCQPPPNGGQQQPPPNGPQPPPLPPPPPPP